MHLSIMAATLKSRPNARWLEFNPKNTRHQRIGVVDRGNSILNFVAYSDRLTAIIPIATTLTPIELTKILINPRVLVLFYSAFTTKRCRNGLTEFSVTTTDLVVPFNIAGDACLSRRSTTGSMQAFFYPSGEHFPNGPGVSPFFNDQEKYHAL